MEQTRAEHVGDHDKKLMVIASLFGGLVRCSTFTEGAKITR
jgi:hypothetical protein